MPLRDAIM